MTTSRPALDMALLTLTRETRSDVAELCRARLEECGVPESLHGGLVRYLVDGVRPGSFLAAVLQNDLHEAVLRAHPSDNLLALTELVRFLFNETPADCWGAPDKVTAWLAERHHRLSFTPR